jgi:hypothetical protein
MTRERLDSHQLQNGDKMFVPFAQWPEVFFEPREKLDLNNPPGT